MTATTTTNSNVKSNKSTLIVTVIIALLALGIGLVVGYLLRPLSDHKDFHQRILEELKGHGAARGVDGSGKDKAAALEMLRDCGQLARDDPSISEHLIRSDVEACRALTCDLPYPRTHVVYKLQGGAIDLDGRLDEKAWQEVGWTDSFVDIQGHAAPPRLETKVKLRYDDNFLFVGLYVEEPEIWANVTMRDGPVYQDNSIQILIDTRQSNVNYKEITVNARGTISDTMMTKSYVDGGEPLSFWDSDLMMDIYVDGSLNNPRSKDKFWTVEMAIPFQSLYQGAGAFINRTKPDHDEIWRANFLRAEWPVEHRDGSSIKGQGTEWWVWQTPEVTNVHLPHKWGLLQFQEAPVNSTHFKTSERWLPTNALLDTYDALKAFHAVTGRYTDRKELLQLPAYIVSGKCLDSLDIELDWSGFKVTAQSKDKNKIKGHTRTDHFLWFGEADMQYF